MSDDPELSAALAKAAQHKMNPEEIRAQKRSFKRGQTGATAEEICRAVSELTQTPSPEPPLPEDERLNLRNEGMEAAKEILLPQIATLTAQLAEARGLLRRHRALRGIKFPASNLDAATNAFLATQPQPARDVVRVVWKASEDNRRHDLFFGLKWVGFCWQSCGDEDKDTWQCFDENTVKMQRFDTLAAAKSALITALNGG